MALYNLRREDMRLRRANWHGGRGATVTVGLNVEPTPDARAFLLSDSTGASVPVRCADDWIQALARPTYTGRACGFYSLLADVAFLLAHLPREELATLRAKRVVHWGAHRVRYYPGAYLAVDRNVFYDGSTFFGDMTLQEACLQAHVAAPNVQVDPRGFTPASANNAVVHAFSFQKAKAVRAILEVVQDDIRKLGFTPKRLSSAGGVASDALAYLLPNPAELEVVGGDYRDVHSYAAQSAVAGFFETYQRGAFQMLYDYDQRAAYPAEMSKLPDLRAGVWTFRRGAPPDVDIGFCRATLTVDRKAYLSPFIMRGQVNYAPVGKWDMYLTMDDVRFAQQYAGFDVDIEDGYYFEPRGPQTRPLERVMRDLYASRARLVVPAVSKLIGNALSGKWQQTIKTRGVWRPGPACNPAFAALVLSRVRLKCFRAMLRNPRAVVGIATDGILTTEPLPVSMLGPDMGDWRLEASGPGLVVHVPQAWELFGQDVNKTPFKTGRRLSDVLREKPGATAYTFTRERMITQREAEQLHSAPTLYGVVDTTLYLNSEDKRAWRNVCGADLLRQSYRSRPLSVQAIRESEAFGAVGRAIAVRYSKGKAPGLA